MAEEREASILFLLRKPGKKWNQKLELFPADQWDKKLKTYSDEWLRCRYRLRLNGKWFCPEGRKYEFFTKWEIRDMLWRSLPFD